MISTFELTLLGSLVSVGGLALLQHRKWLPLSTAQLAARETTGTGTTSESRAGHARSAAIAGTRWLTVGALTLFLAYTHGAQEGYLFGPWSDVLFHVVFVSASWSMTAYRIKQAAGRSTSPSFPDTSVCRTSD